MRSLFTLLGALVFACTMQQAVAEDKPYSFSVRNNGPETLTVGCAYNQGTVIAVDASDSVTCSGKASSSTYVYFGDEARRTHSCPVNESVYVRVIAYSYDSERDDSFRVDESYCEVVAQPVPEEEDTDDDDDGGGTLTGG